MAAVAAWLAFRKRTDEGLAKNLGHKIAFRRAVAIAFGEHLVSAPDSWPELLWTIRDATARGNTTDND